MKHRTQITGLGPVMADGSRKIFDKEPKPFIATATWLEAQALEPAVGDYLDIGEDGSVTLIAEASVSSATIAVGAGVAAAQVVEAQKKTDGGEELPPSSKPSAPKYRAKPVLVAALKIAAVAEERNPDGTLLLHLEDGDDVSASPEMLARITPRVGDYWIVQEDGYVYLNPADVFERKYELVTE